MLKREMDGVRKCALSVKLTGFRLRLGIKDGKHIAEIGDQNG